MIDQQIRQQTQTYTAPSKKRIAAATAIALVVAGILLVTVVLPAEYGIDPLGTGKALRLTDLAAASQKKPPEAAPSDAEATTIAPRLEQSPNGGAPVMRGAFIGQPKGYRTDSREYTLRPKEGMEVKYNMKKGAGLIYSWKASGKLMFEFHGEPNLKPEGKQGTDYYETYELDDQVGKDQSNGTFVAPSTGIHGWFWENKSENPVTLKLMSAGFYDWILQNRDDKQAALKPMDPEAAPGHPTVPDEPLK